ncbi:hypothetical protein [Winogradskyella luteola]|uniref:Uncharacterized protein n=1 Tax=Winogradskyella luteola TaxID=2828330 RepID=A0A9X1FA74_9FLAO|nr:hypothetical protein [Winogradskyella luteola]MBV7270147.1 hypothetical protein [Winogradskyella luteola]
MKYFKHQQHEIMHWKTKNKLINNTTKIYLIEPEEDKAIELRLQLHQEYIAFELHLPIPKHIQYKSLLHGGFNYNPETDIPITHYQIKRVIRNLENSKFYRNNKSETIDELIVLLNSMSCFL